MFIHRDEVKNNQSVNISEISLNFPTNFKFVLSLRQTHIGNPRYLLYCILFGTAKYVIAFPALDESMPSTRWTRGCLGSSVNSETQIRGRREISIFSGCSFSSKGGYRVEGCGSFISECFSKICTPHANETIYPGMRY